MMRITGQKYKKSPFYWKRLIQRNPIKGYD